MAKKKKASSGGNDDSGLPPPISREQAEAKVREQRKHEVRQVLLALGVISSALFLPVLFLAPYMVILSTLAYGILIFIIAMAYIGTGQEKWTARFWHWRRKTKKEKELEIPPFRGNTFFIENYGRPDRYLWTWRVGIPIASLYIIEITGIAAGVLLGDLLGLAILIVSSSVMFLQTLILTTIYVRGRQEANILDGTDVYNISNIDLITGLVRPGYPFFGCGPPERRPLAVGKLKEQVEGMIEKLEEANKGNEEATTYVESALGLRGRALTADEIAMLKISYSEFIEENIKYCPYCGEQITKPGQFCENCEAYLEKHNSHGLHCFYIPCLYVPTGGFMIATKTGDLSAIFPKESMRYHLRTRKKMLTTLYAYTITMFPFQDIQPNPDNTEETKKAVLPVFYVRQMPVGDDWWGPKLQTDILFRSSLGEENSVKLDRQLSAVQMTNAELQDSLANFKERGMVALWAFLEDLMFGRSAASVVQPVVQPLQAPGQQQQSPTQAPGLQSAPPASASIGRLNYLVLCISIVVTILATIVVGLITGHITL